MAKSLKFCFTDSLVKKAVEKWKFDDYIAWLKKHENEAKSDKGLPKKMVIVLEIFEEKQILTLLSKECMKYLLNFSNSNIKAFEDITTKVANRFAGIVNKSSDECLEYLLNFSDKQGFEDATNKVANKFAETVNKYNECLEYLLNFSDESTFGSITSKIKKKFEEFVNKMEVKDFENCLVSIRDFKGNTLSTEVYIMTDTEFSNKYISKMKLIDITSYFFRFGHCADKRKLFGYLSYKISNECLEKGLKNGISGKERKEYLRYSGRNIWDLANEIQNKRNDIWEKIKDPDIFKQDKFYEKYTYGGVQLWRNGYDVEGFLGAGGFGAVWKCNGNKAIKYVPKYNGYMRKDGKNDGDLTEFANGRGAQYDAFQIELMTVQQVQKIFAGLSKKEKRHLAKMDPSKDNAAFFESELATNDLLDDIANNVNKTLDFKKFLNEATDIIDAVVDLHEAGFSHNDIKPENILRIRNDVKKVTNNVKKANDNVKLTDFGIITKIDDTRTCSGTQGYTSPDWCLPEVGKSNPTRYEPEAVAKRDVYSLGITFAYRFCGQDNVLNALPHLKDKRDRKKFLEVFKPLYPNVSVENKTNMANLIYDMTEPSYKNRISVEKASERIKKIKAN